MLDIQREEHSGNGHTYVGREERREERREGEKEEWRDIPWERKDREGWIEGRDVQMGRGRMDKSEE